VESLRWEISAGLKNPWRALPGSCFATTLGNSGAGEGIRTPDRLITNQMLYQLSYASPYNPSFLPESRHTYVSASRHGHENRDYHSVNLGAMAAAALESVLPRARKALNSAGRML
jgi:hypothetical protein